MEKFIIIGKASCVVAVFFYLLSGLVKPYGRFSKIALSHFNITPDLVNQMSDEDLSNYLPRHGDRIRLRSELRKRRPQQRKHKLLMTLQQKLQTVTENNQQSKHTVEDMRHPHRPFGNRNAFKATRLIELGWIHKSNKRTIQVRKNKGGGTRKTEISKMALKSEILEEAIALFFPNGTSPKGSRSDFNFDLWDFSDRPIGDDVTVNDMYEQTKMPLLRFYLSSTPKNKSEGLAKSHASASAASEVEANDAIGQPVNRNDDFNKLPKTLELPGLSPHAAPGGLDDRLQDNNGGDILSNAMEFVGLPLFHDEDDFLPDPGFSIAPDSDELTVTEPPVKEITLKLHRGHLLQEFITAFKEINPTQDIVSLEMVMPDGTLEAAEDGGGVTRDALSDFWTSFYDQCTLGTKFKVPCLRHDFAQPEWESVAKIILFGWKSSGYFPIQLSLPFMEQCIFGKTSTPLINAFFEVIAEDEATTLKKALSSFSSVDQDDLLDVLQLHDSKTLPTAENIENLINEIAHKEIIQTPMFIVDCFQPVQKQLSTSITKDQLVHLYSELIPTLKLVNRMFKFPEPMSADEQTVANHLRRLIREMSSDTLRKFMRFCTGSDLLINKEIKVEFVNVSGLARRPIAHTCSCLLELSRNYESFPQFRSEFFAVLASNIWIMDIV